MNKNFKTAEDAVILSIDDDRHYFTMELSSPEISSRAKAGQFVNVRISESFDPLLRRPFSICDAYDGKILLLIQKKGKGTEQLFQKKAGTVLNILGPLGKPYPKLFRKPIFLAGGAGIAPFLFLSRYYPASILLLGVRSLDFLPDLKRFEKNCHIMLITDDGSSGKKGNILDLITPYLPENHSFMACGPNPMMKALQNHFLKLPEPDKVDAYFSLENLMACGFGACKGCAIPEMDTNGYRLVCKDGPAFFWNEIRL